MAENQTKEKTCTCGNPKNCKCGIDQPTEVSNDNFSGCGCGGSCNG